MYFYKSVTVYVSVSMTGPLLRILSSDCDYKDPCRCPAIFYKVSTYGVSVK